MHQSTIVPEDTGETLQENDFHSENSQPGIPLDELDSNQNDVEIEKKTGLIQMTSSPSLSALAGLLNEKTQRADRMVKRLSSVVMNEVLEEDCLDTYAEPKENHVANQEEPINSPNLIDLDDNGSAVIFDAPTVDQQLDFLSTPEFTQNSTLEHQIQHNVLEKEEQNHSQTSTSSRSNSMYSDLPVDGTENASVSSFVGMGSIVKRDSISGTKPTKSTKSINSRNEVGMEKEKNTAAREVLTRNVSTLSKAKRNETTKASKRRSMLSFWRKPKTSTEKKELPPSTSTRSLPKTPTTEPFHSSNEPDPPKPIRKKSLSTSNLFSSLRKTKRKQVQPYHIEEQNKALLPKKNVTSNDINKRKLTPLHFQRVISNKGEEAVVEEGLEDQAAVEPDQDLEDSRPIKIEGDLFPKSLDANEINSIVSLEQSRSTKSAQRNSVSSFRRSLTDHISLTAKNEGMFVTDGNGLVLSTPDLSKSPASSILKNGRFEMGEGLKDSPKNLDNSFLDSQNELELPTHQAHLSFESIEEKLNELTVLSETEENMNISPHPCETGVSQNENINPLDIDDKDLISDIMEFANIIDFGHDLDFNFELNPDSSSYQTLNPSKIASEGQSFTSEMIKNNSDHGSSIRQNTDVLCSNENIENKNSSPNSMIDQKALSFFDSELIHEEEFENEDFNDIQFNKESPNINAFLPEPNPPFNRPISMSFRGLRAPKFNSNMELSHLSMYDSSSQSFVEGNSMGELWKTVRFSSQIILYETFGELEYDRHPDIATCNQLTPQLAQLIKEELNELKSAMDVHEDSRCYTHFV